MVRGALILVVMVAMAAGCLGGSAAPPPSGHLHVQVSLSFQRETPCETAAGCDDLIAVTHSYSLRCGPAAGTMPNPQAACEAIDDLVTHHRRPMACMGVLRGGLPQSTASITGRFANRPFRLHLTNDSWCGQPTPVVRDYWALSTFPCSTTVIHYDYTHETYERWAHRSGCTT